MAAVIKRLLRYSSWLLPLGMHELYRQIQSRAVTHNLLFSSLLAANTSLKNRNQGGKRCFILGNGPSVKQLDLASLQGETVISVSNGYLHHGYTALAPAFHCVPQITYGRMTEEDVLVWFNEMHLGIGNAELFLNETEATIVKKYELFPGRKVHYLAFHKNFDEIHERKIIDISQPVPRVESVPVMALMIALYMGFEHIILLGVDHDHFKTNRYVYAFDLQAQKGKDISVTTDGVLTTRRYEDFQSLARLWRQYRVLQEIAIENGRTILNANPFSELDEFPRVPLDLVLCGRYEAV